MSPPAFETGNRLAPFTGLPRILRFVFQFFVTFLVVPACAQETSRAGFVSEYIRELGVNQHTRIIGNLELTPPSVDNNQLTGIIQNSTRIQSDLRAQIQLLQGIHLKPPFDTLPSKIVQLYTDKVELHQRLIDATALHAEAKVSVGFASSSSDITKITVSLENIDRSLFETTPLVFATLVARAPDDKNGRVGRLNITKAERQVLLRSIATGFGKTMEQNNRDFILRSALLLRDSLLKYKGSDERN